MFRKTTSMIFTGVLRRLSVVMMPFWRVSCLPRAYLRTLIICVVASRSFGELGASGGIGSYCSDVRAVSPEPPLI
ncbi:MAG: hypothetical protein V9E98_10535, partial [Candidatus Nanopelagicales bacterium]